MMLPMKYESSSKKRDALLGAFVDRFLIGFLIPNVYIGIPYQISGLLLGIGLSLPSAIITRAYAPITGIGGIGGLVIGLISGVVL